MKYVFTLLAGVLFGAWLYHKFQPKKVVKEVKSEEPKEDLSKNEFDKVSEIPKV